MEWLLVAISLIGVLLNIYKSRWGFACWIVSNAGWMVIDYREGIYSQAALFAVYFVLAVWGIGKWKPEREEGDE
jgi:nicotinamide riboside transporter PnuC